MSISHRTRKKLWGLAASRCMFESCRKVLVEDHPDSDGFTLIGEEAHIVSGQEKGPRYSSDFPKEKVDEYGNLLLLCSIHHAIVDNDVTNYTPTNLIEIKKKHEQWVTASLGIDEMQQNDDEQYSEFVDTIETLAGFDRWDEWTETLPGGHLSRIEINQYNDLVRLHKYLRNRNYPKSRLVLNQEIGHFNEVLEDFLNSLRHTTENKRSLPGYFVTEQLYKSGVWPINTQYEIEWTIELLIFELTKSANRLCDVIRKELIKSYRRQEGILLMKDAPICGIAYMRLEYAEGEKYNGLHEIHEEVRKRIRERLGD